MNFKQYQEKSRRTAIYPRRGKDFIYPALGLGGETGEVLDKIKKIIRDKNYKVDQLVRSELEKELGDVLWYLAQLATELKLSLDQIAKTNLKKLNSRLKRDQIKGSGDNR
ncbi:MAG: nucleoside triphosphate pyrophosphohydrolase family protein [Patescibacteria group bacterium]|nr:nucleoside triphosphate pyrophosphohydrolase family protein [Patescibacteria group bacterium]MCL5257669.1 nucleoside triphosphate pyrophosphohydrolase family protein [Patescibacteria group bacterium]